MLSHSLGHNSVFLEHPMYKQLQEECPMKNEDQQTSEGLNQMFEIINAKGDTGELQQIVQKSDNQSNDKQQEKSF